MKKEMNRDERLSYCESKPSIEEIQAEIPQAAVQGVSVIYGLDEYINWDERENDKIDWNQIHWYSLKGNPETFVFKHPNGNWYYADPQGYDYCHYIAKVVDKNLVRCPECGHQWESES